MTLALANITDALTAWSTLGAVIVALCIATAPALWRWSKRTRIEIAVGSDRVHLLYDPPNAPDKQIVRASVRNASGRAAQRARAQITALQFYGKGIVYADGQTWEQLIDVPIWLKWASRDHSHGPDAEEVDLARGMTDYLNLSMLTLMEDRDGQYHFLIGKGYRPKRPSLLEKMRKVGEYEIEVTVFCDDVEPTSAVVGYEITLAHRQLQNVRQLPVLSSTAHPGPEAS
jgi:hypothetical protein